MKSSIIKKKGPIYLLTDRRISGLRHSSQARRAVAGGIRIIQLRDKDMSKRDLYREAVKIRAITADAGALFIVNDYLDIAIACKADGAHLGQEDLSVAEARKIAGRKMIIGVSTHSLVQAMKAQEGGADYIGFGPVFETATKDAGKPRGLDNLRRICKMVRVPVVAIGGINSENINKVLASGAAACAMASAVLGGDMKRNVKSFYDALGISMAR